MKLTFIYDGTLFYDEYGNYYGRAYAALPEKYRTLADDITFMMRTQPLHSSGYMKMPEDIHVVSVPNIANPKIYLKEKRTLRRIVAKQIENSDMIILREPCFFSSIVNRELQRTGKPYIVESVGCPWDSYRNHGVIGKLLAPFEYLQTKRSIAHAPFVYYVTKEFLQKRYPTKGVSVGISDVELEPTDEAVLEKRLKRIENHTGTWKIGTAGAVNVSYKGQQFVIEALAKLKAQGHMDFEYHLAGSGAPTHLKSLVEKLGVEQQVVFEGSIPHDKMFDWLDSLDIYIQPSLQEGLPRAVVEAMSRALPVFGARTGGIPELLADSFSFPQKNSRSIAKILSDNSKETMKEMAKMNFESAKDYDISKLEEKRNAFYLSFFSFVRGYYNG